MTERLFKWTGERWIISLSKNYEVKSIHEKKLEDRNMKLEEFKKSRIAKDFEKAFPDANLIDVKDQE